MTTAPAVYPIVKYGDRLLERPAEPVVTFDAALEELVDAMFQTMYMAQGIGLAAPQISKSISLAVIDVTGGKETKAKLVLANPEIIGGDAVIGIPAVTEQEEGCLSVPGFRGIVRRPRSVTIRAQNVKGVWFEMNGTELLARAFCHEIDHLHGALYLDHLGPLKRDLIRRKIKKLQKAGQW